MRLVLFEPDIPQNAGTILRLAACLGVGVDVIEPCGFVWSEPRLRRAGMDYLEFAQVERHSSWTAYQASGQPGRLVLLSTRGATMGIRTAKSAAAWTESGTPALSRPSSSRSSRSNRASGSAVAPRVDSRTSRPGCPDAW